MRVLLYYFLFSLALCVLTISCGGGGNRTLPAYLANYDTLIADWNASVVLQREGLPADEYARAVWSAVLYHRIIEDTAPDEIIVWDEKVPGDTLYEFAFDYFGRHPDAYFNTLLVFDKAYIDFYADRMEAAQEKLLSVIPLLDEVKEGYYLKYLVNGLLALIYTIHNMPEDEAYYQRAYDAAEAGGMPVFEARALSGLAHCHSDQGQYAQAIGEMKRVVAIGEKILLHCMSRLGASCPGYLGCRAMRIVRCMPPESRWSCAGSKASRLISKSCAVPLFGHSFS